MIAWIKSCYSTPTPPTVEELAAAELDEARRELLGAKTELERACARVDFHAARVRRLEKFVRGEG